MTMAVACVSLLVAAIGVARLLSHEFEGWTEGKELAIGAAVIDADRRELPGGVPHGRTAPPASRGLLSLRIQSMPARVRRLATLSYA